MAEFIFFRNADLLCWCGVSVAACPLYGLPYLTHFFIASYIKGQASLVIVSKLMFYFIVNNKYYSNGLIHSNIVNINNVDIVDILTTMCESTPTFNLVKRHQPSHFVVYSASWYSVLWYFIILRSGFGTQSQSSFFCESQVSKSKGLNLDGLNVGCSKKVYIVNYSNRASLFLFFFNFSLLD